MTPRWMTGFAALLALLPACGGGQYASESGDMVAPGVSVERSFAGAAGASDGDFELTGRRLQGTLGGEAAGDAPTEAEPERYAQADTGAEEPETASDGRAGPLLVYRADLALAVHQVADKLARIETLATEAGGHLSQRTMNSIRVRVPAAQFQPVLSAILELGDVLRRDVQVDDVTEEFHDVQLRIRTLEAMYQRVSRMLENATNMEQALAVEQHLERITMDLERMRGRLRFLSDQVAFSTITVSFTERTEVSEPEFELPFPWLRALGLDSLLRLR